MTLWMYAAAVALEGSTLLWLSGGVVWTCFADLLLSGALENTSESVKLSGKENKHLPLLRDSQVDCSALRLGNAPLACLSRGSIIAARPGEKWKRRHRGVFNLLLRRFAFLAFRFY